MRQNQKEKYSQKNKNKTTEKVSKVKNSDSGKCTREKHGHAHGQHSLRTEEGKNQEKIHWRNPFGKFLGENSLRNLWKIFRGENVLRIKLINYFHVRINYVNFSRIEYI